MAWKLHLAAQVIRVIRSRIDYAVFFSVGGIKVLDGNLGRAIIKMSAVKAQHRVVAAVRSRSAMVAAATGTDLTDIQAVLALAPAMPVATITRLAEAVPVARSAAALAAPRAAPRA